jgi:flagellar assembly factor FliW
VSDTRSVPELHFDGGVPGFPDARRFVLVRLGEDDSPFSMLCSLENPDLEFVVVPPGVFFPEYEPEIDDDVVERLGLGSADDAILLTIVTVAERAQDSTANLLGPIVVNRHTRAAAQAILDTGAYDSREALLPS